MKRNKGRPINKNNNKCARFIIKDTYKITNKIKKYNLNKHTEQVKNV